VTTLIENDEVIGVYSDAINRTDYQQKGYSWSKEHYNGGLRYEIRLQYSLQVQSLDWVSSIGDVDYWWDAFDEDADEDVDYFNGQNNTSVSASTSLMVFYVNRSDNNSREGPVNCIKGHCPE
jgi:hypothetical protein